MAKLHARYMLESVWLHHKNAYVLHTDRPVLKPAC